MNRNENSKTLWFLAAAAALVAVAWLSRPVTAVKTEASVKKLFRDFDKPDVVESLEVLQFDQAKGDSVLLKVAKVNGLWVIPSHSNYPADAKDHLAAAANSLIDLTILGMAPGFDANSKPMDETTLRQAHNRFGVVDPDPKNVKSNDAGVGTRVTMTDAGGHQLASAIIGKSLPDQSDQCYIRETGKDPVYVVKLDTSKLSVRFEDWIEPNLLNLNAMDLKKVQIKDYSVAPMAVQGSDGQVELQLVKTPKGEFVLDTPAGDQPWKLVQDMAFDPAKKNMVARPMAADEEVNATNLDALKTELEGLKIVDVERKPSAVPADLRVRKIDKDTVQTLSERGFFVCPVSKDPDVPLEIFSNSGDITLQMADGARYILRFGVTTGESSAAEKKKKGGAKYDKEEKAKDDASPGMDRYLFVTADFNQDAIPKPVFDKLPEEKPAQQAPEKKGDAKETKAAEGDKKADAKIDDKKPQPKKEEPKKVVPAKSGDLKKDEPKKEEDKKDPPEKNMPSGSDDANQDEPKKDDVKKDDVKKDDVKKDEPKKDESKKGEAKKDEPKKDEPKKDEPKKDEPKKDEPKKDDVKKAEPKAGDAKKDEPKKEAVKEVKDPAALAAERKRIETENKRRQDEYDSKVAAGKKHAKELSDRFAQWYYVIPGQTYAKIHLDRKEIVKKKEPPKAADSHDHDHDHDHGSLPASPAGTLEQLKKDAPAAPEKK